MDLDWEGDKITHTKLSLGLVLHKDVQEIIDLEERCVYRVGEHLDKLTQLRVQGLCLAKLLICAWDLEVEILIEVNLGLTSLLFDLDQVLLSVEKADALSVVALDLSLELELEGLYRFGTLLVFHSDLHGD